MPKRKRPREGRERGLIGAWWRCSAHGLTADPLVLGGHPYCPDERCEMAVRLVHTVADDEPDVVARRWNDREPKEVRWATT